MAIETRASAGVRSSEVAHGDVPRVFVGEPIVISDCQRHRVGPCGGEVVNRICITVEPAIPEVPAPTNDRSVTLAAPICEEAVQIGTEEVEVSIRWA